MTTTAINTTIVELMTSLRVGQATFRISRYLGDVLPGADLLASEPPAAGPGAAAGVPACRRPASASCAWSDGSSPRHSRPVDRRARHGCRAAAGQEGLEPATAGFGDRCSTNLSYFRYSHVVNWDVAAETADALPRPEVRLLHHVACVLLVRGQPQREVVGVEVRPADELLERPAGRRALAAAITVPPGLRGSVSAVDQSPLSAPADRGSARGTTRDLAQRVSLCTVCLRSQRQYFFISMRSRSFTLDFLVM